MWAHQYWRRLLAHIYGESPWWVAGWPMNYKLTGHCGGPTAWMAGWLAGCSLAGWPAGWMAAVQSDGRQGLPTDRPSDCLAGWLAGWLGSCLTGWPTWAVQAGWPAGQLAGWLAAQLPII